MHDQDKMVVEKPEWLDRYPRFRRWQGQADGGLDGACDIRDLILLVSHSHYVWQNPLTPMGHR
jgi:hypothetical protein